MPENPMMRPYMIYTRLGVAGLAVKATKKKAGCVGARASGSVALGGYKSFVRQRRCRVRVKSLLPGCSPCK